MRISAKFMFKGMRLSCAPFLCMYRVCAREKIKEADISQIRASEGALLADNHLRSVCTHRNGVS